MATTIKPGDIGTWDFQADMFQGQYRFVEQTGRNEWIIEQLPPSEELIERAFQHYSSPGAYLGIHDPWGPERRDNTPEEAWVEEITNREERAGEQMKIRIVSRATYDAAF